jgi:type VI secretion system VasD/TssJ family lipoprotein
MMNMTKWANRSMFLSVFLGLSVIMLSLMSGCLASGPVWVSLLGTEKMNDGRPALVCLYELKSSTNFMGVPLASFWKEGEKAFGSDLVKGKTEIMLSPLKTEWFPLQVSKETNYIGVAVDFRRADAQGWRLVYSLIEKKPKEIYLRVVGNRVEIDKKK